MAIDTKEKRISATLFYPHAKAVNPADGVNQADRQDASWSYRGILAIAIPIFTKLKQIEGLFLKERQAEGSFVKEKQIEGLFVREKQASGTTTQQKQISTSWTKEKQS